MREADLSALEMRVSYNGVPAGEALGSAVLGNPARSAAWLANKLLEFGVSLEPGDVIISGAFMKMLPFRSGDEFAFSLTDQPDLKVTIG
jgi:2-keto-4-pentenoate hydratase